MNYTENYQLPLWDKDDAVKRTDFNENNRKIDAALAEKSQVVCGSYTITSTDQPFTVSLGFRPKAVLIWKIDVSYNSSAFYNYIALLLDGYPIQTSSGAVIGAVCDDGFTLKQQIASTNGQSYYPRIADCGTYIYVAFS